MQAGLAALAAAGCAAWAFAWADAGDFARWAGAAALSGVVGAIAWRAFAERDCELSWDGARWTADGQTCVVRVALELGGGLLLHLQPLPAPGRAGRPMRARWLAVSTREGAQAMHGLRAALYSRPPSGDSTPPVAGPEIHKP